MLYYYYIINRDVKQNISLATRITRNLLDKHEAYVQIRQASYCRTRKNFTILILINQVNWLYHEAKTFQYYKGVQLLISHQLSIVQKLQCLKQRQHHLQVLFRLRSGNSRRLTNQSTISRSAAPSRAPSVPSSPGYSSADDSRLLYWYAAQTVENLLITNTWADWLRGTCQSDVVGWQKNFHSRRSNLQKVFNNSTGHRLDQINLVAPFIILIDSSLNICDIYSCCGFFLL